MPQLLQSHYFQREYVNLDARERHLSEADTRPPETGGRSADSPIRQALEPAGRQPPPSKQQATPGELAVLMVETVCVSASGEREALQELADFLQVERSRVESELMFLRAFAVDFATTMALGDSPERMAISALFYEHWEAVSDQAGTVVLDDLQDRIGYYTEVIHAPEDVYQGLAGQVGAAFAACCRAGGDGTEEEGQEEAAMLGGSMFAALFDEVSEMLSGLDIVLYES